MGVIDTILEGENDYNGRKVKDYDQKQLAVGKLVEAEHFKSFKSMTDKDYIVTSIAMDHLDERADYYTVLIESGLADEKDAVELYNKFYKQGEQK